MKTSIILISLLSISGIFANKVEIFEVEYRLEPHHSPFQEFFRKPKAHKMDLMLDTEYML